LLDSLLQEKFENDQMVICVGARSSGKTLFLSLLKNNEFDPDSLLVPTVGVNIFRIEIALSKKKREVFDIRELGGELAPVWADYIKSDNSVIFVIDSSNIGQVGIVGVKLCQCLKILEQTSVDSNQVCRLCIVWTRHNIGDIANITRLLRLKELLHDTSVVTTQIIFDKDNTELSLNQVEAWLLSTVK